MIGVENCAVFLVSMDEELIVVDEFTNVSTGVITSQCPLPTQKQALEHGAANGRNEPNAEMSKSCCVRSQHGILLRRRETHSASQRQMRSFRHHAAILKP